MPAPTSFVARHATDPGDGTFAKRLDTKRRHVRNGRTHLAGHPGNACSLHRHSLFEAALLQLVEPDSPAIVGALRRAGRGVVACCALVSPGEGPVVLDIEGGPVTAQRWSSNNLITVGGFTDGFYAALAAGDDAVLDALARVDVRALRVEGVFPEEYQFHWARALQGFWLGASWTADALIAALRESAPEHLRNGDSSTAYMFFKSSLEIELLGPPRWTRPRSTRRCSRPWRTTNATSRRSSRTRARTSPTTRSASSRWGRWRSPP